MTDEVKIEIPVSQEEPNVEEIVIEAQAPDPEAAQKPADKKPSGEPFKDALRQFEHQVGVFGQMLGDALQGRGNVVMVRVNDEALKHLDMLVEAEMTKSRSESAAFLISAGIQANQALFDKIGTITQQIASLREQLRKQVQLGDEEPASEPEA